MKICWQFVQFCPYALLTVEKIELRVSCALFCSWLATSRQDSFNGTLNPKPQLLRDWCQRARGDSRFFEECVVVGMEGGWIGVKQYVGVSDNREP